MATVAINNGMNAGLLAVRILVPSIPNLVLGMDDYLLEQANEVKEKATKLEQVGWVQYVRQ